MLGKTRPQAIPCDSNIQVEDRSAFTVKELSGAMSRPTYTALQRLKKMVGYLKSTPDYCVLLEIPVGGQGRWHSADQYWLLESFSDSDWSSNQMHRRSTSCGVHMLNAHSFLPAQDLSA